MSQERPIQPPLPGMKGSSVYSTLGIDHPTRVSRQPDGEGNIEVEDHALKTGVDKMMDEFQAATVGTPEPTHWSDKL